jgi:hypothetical protein
VVRWMAERPAEIARVTGKGQIDLTPTSTPVQL